jgi:hypothetical protein
MAYTFDGANKLVILSTGTENIDLADLWSRWKDWLLQGNAGYARAFDTVGGEGITEGVRIPLYLFMQNGWQIRPDEADHTLSVFGGILIGDGGGDPFVSTLGDYTVRVVYQQPVQAIGYSTEGGTGPTAAQIASAVVAALQATTIPVDVRKINATTLTGTGTAGNEWGPA